MAHYLFHLHEAGAVTPDEQGHDFDDMESARRYAVRSARDIMSGEMRDGCLCLDCFIQVENVDDGTAFTVLFRDAVAISQKDASPHLHRRP
ncbi:DUF6894 family protein [Sphingomonas immobilis]|uniref:DUF6894 domain-containing protein n=1 Tax=Sphingomonas immobilis TaxID=3063997 RepID=A0ABT8ZYV4_9SPHN|nr:hypothetical protein [Sphingomonas sp. CA1-15]MDO7841956.1 hypothetical protein [Sphingomonas sp. CA1-15]